MKLAKLNTGAEIFYSIQGEGPSMGKPAIFVRLSLCNLHCTWCDTDYTWNWKGTKFSHDNDKLSDYEKFDKQEWIIEHSIETIVSKVSDYPCERIILTGGEPLMQQAELTELAKLLKARGYFLEIETNGTIIPNNELVELIDQYNVSPKLSNSNNELKLRYKEKALSFFATTNKTYFKFVISEQKDLDEVKQMVNDLEISYNRVYLMPEGTSPNSLNEKQLWLVEICKEYGFNFTDRLHIKLYGKKRGI